MRNKVKLHTIGLGLLIFSYQPSPSIVFCSRLNMKSRVVFLHVIYRLRSNGWVKRTFSCIMTIPPQCFVIRKIPLLHQQRTNIIGLLVKTPQRVNPLERNSVLNPFNLRDLPPELFQSYYTIPRTTVLPDGKYTCSSPWQ